MRILAYLLILGCAVSPSFADRPIAARDALRGRAFTVAPDSGITSKGATEKYLLRDDRGATWLFKPMRPDEAAIEEACREVALLCGIDSPEVFCVGVGKSVTGSLARVIDSLGGLRSRPPESLDERQREQLLRLFVFDWAVGNFDTHPNNFLVTKDGGIVPIDFGLAFDDRGELFELDLKRRLPFLDLSYFKLLWKAYATGKIELDLDGAIAFADRVSQIPRASFDAVLLPVAKLRIQALGHVLRDRYGDVSMKHEAQFTDFFAQRRQSLREDLESFFDRMSRSRGAGAYTAPSRPSDAAASPAAPKQLASFAPVPIALAGADALFSTWNRSLRNTTHLVGRLFSEPGIAIAGAHHILDGNLAALQHWLYRAFIGKSPAPAPASR